MVQNTITLRQVPGFSKLVIENEIYVCFFYDFPTVYHKLWVFYHSLRLQ